VHVAGIKLVSGGNPAGRSGSMSMLVDCATECGLSCNFAGMEDFEPRCLFPGQYQDLSLYSKRIKAVDWWNRQHDSALPGRLKMH
jgi:hypothetical protein